MKSFNSAKIAVLLTTLSVGFYGCGKKRSRSHTKEAVGDTMSFQRKASALEAAKNLSFNTQHVREQLILGKDGVAELGRKINSTSEAWRDGWLEVSRLIDTLDGGSLLDDETKLIKEMRKQEDRIIDLQYTLKEMGVRTEAVASLLDGTPKISYDLTGDMASHNDEYKAMLQEAEILKTSSAQIFKFNQQAVDKFTKATPILKDALRARMISQYIKKNITALEQATAMVQEMFTAEVLLDPIEYRVRSQRSALYRAQMSGRIFAFQKQYPAFASVCQDALAEVGRMNFSARVKLYTTDQINKDCREMADVNSRFTGFSQPTIAQYLKSQSTFRLNAAKRICTVEASSATNCTLYQELSRIPPERIAGMSTDGLKSLEQAFDWMESGNSSSLLSAGIPRR